MEEDEGFKEEVTEIADGVFQGRNLKGKGCDAQGATKPFYTTFAGGSVRHRGAVYWVIFSPHRNAADTP